MPTRTASSPVRARPTRARRCTSGRRGRHAAGLSVCGRCRAEPGPRRPGERNEAVRAVARRPPRPLLGVDDARRAALVERLSTTPPGMPQRGRRACGSPITTKRYGGAQQRAVDPTRRRCRLRRRRRRVLGDHPDAGPSTLAIWIASAPAARSSWSASSRTSGADHALGSVMVSATPGPRAGTVPARIPEHLGAGAAPRSSAAWRRRRRRPALARSPRGRATSACSRSLRSVRSSRIWTRSSCRASPNRPSSWVERTCTTAAKPSTARAARPRPGPVTRGRSADRSRPARPAAAARVGPAPAGARRGRPRRRRAVVMPGRGAGGSRRRWRRSGCRARRRRRSTAAPPTPSWSPRKTTSAATSDVAHERHDEDPVVEDAVEQRPHAAEDGVERGDDRDRQVGLQPGRHGRLEDQAERRRRRRAPRAGITRCPPWSRVAVRPAGAARRARSEARRRPAPATLELQAVRAPV